MQVTYLSYLPNSFTMKTAILIFFVDDEMRRRLETKLIIKILAFKVA